MKVDTVQDVRRNTQFTVASMMKGTGIIRPETCRALISGSGSSSPTRTLLRAHFNGASTAANSVAGTASEAAGNLTSGFTAEYAQA